MGTTVLVVEQCIDNLSHRPQIHETFCSGLSGSRKQLVLYLKYPLCYLEPAGVEFAAQLAHVLELIRDFVPVGLA